MNNCCHCHLSTNGHTNRYRNCIQCQKCNSYTHDKCLGKIKTFNKYNSNYYLTTFICNCCKTDSVIKYMNNMELSYERQK